MTSTIQLSLLRLATSLLLLASFAAGATGLPTESRVPGGIAFVPVPGGEMAPTVMFNTHRVAVRSSRRSVDRGGRHSARGETG